MLSKLISVITGAPIEKAIEFIQARQEAKQKLKLAKIQGQIAKEEAKAKYADKRAEETHTWEMAHIANSGWKDEFVLLVIYIPVIMGFVPGMEETALAGFAVMAKMPIWYQALLVTVSLAIYGVRAYQGKNIVGRILGKDEK